MVQKASTLLLFGATGDLARRMLLPSLYGLDSDGLLPTHWQTLDQARRAWDTHHEIGLHIRGRTTLILPDDTAVCFTILEAENRPVSAVADQIEVRDVAKVEVRLDRERSLTLLFDPEHALDERIAMEQFAT